MEQTRVTVHSQILLLNQIHGQFDYHVYVSDVALLEFCCTAPPLTLSDHRSVLVSLSWSHSPVRKHRRLVWRYSAADYDAPSDGLNCPCAFLHYLHLRYQPALVSVDGSVPQSNVQAHP